MSFKSKFFKVEWTIAYRKRSGDLLFEDGGCKQEFIPIANSSRYWCADPFSITYKNRKFLFFEMYDRLKRKGCIGYREIVGGNFLKMVKCYETNAHLSYPNVFVYNDDLYMIPESNNLKKLILLKAVENKNKLEFRFCSAIMENKALADTTFLEKDGQVYLFATPVSNNDNVGTLSMYYKKDGWVEFKDNPVVDDRSVARMAGRFINYGDKVIRCSQDCTNGYGEGLNFSVVNECSIENGYSELLLKKVAKSDISIDGVADFDGIHTYNFDEEFEFIDYKKDRVFSFNECIGYALDKMHLTKKVRRED